MKPLRLAVAVLAVMVPAALAAAHPCPGDGNPGKLDAFVRPGDDSTKSTAFTRSARVTVTDVGGDIVGQGEGSLNDMHRFELPPGRYELVVEGEGLRTIRKSGVVVVANKTTDSKTFVVSGQGVSER